MSWTKYDDSGTRWSWTADDERHLLLFDTASGELREYHEVPAPAAVTVHVYQPDDWYEGRTESHGNPSAIVYPLLEVTHIRTYEVAGEHAPWVRALDDREAFEWLAAAGYADASGGAA